MVTMATHDVTDTFNQEVNRLMMQLSDAIREGKLEQARSSAVELGKMRAKVALVLRQPEAETLMINVKMVRRGESKGSLRLTVNPKWTFEQLKYMVQDEHHLSANTQIWVCGRRFPNEKDTLESWDIKQDDTLGLYVSSKAFHNFEQKRPLRVHVPVPRVREDTTAVVDLEQDGLQGATNTDPPRTGRPQVAPPAPPPPPPANLPQKWSCPVCTFENEATRPGCEMCSTDRPEDFQVPHDYQPSQDEQRRLENEANMTSLLQQDPGMVIEGGIMAAIQVLAQHTQHLNQPDQSDDEN